MGDYTDIEWATHTLNWWTGCEHVSPACAHCYAEAWAKRAGRDFGERRLTTEANRRKPLKWEANAAEFEREHGHRQRIFVNSLSDVFDNKVSQEWRESLFEMIRRTPSLDYLLLTKRIGNAERMLPADWGDGYPNVWLGATVANQEEAERDVPKLLCTRAAIRFLSCEPMLGPIDLRNLNYDSGDRLPCAMRINDGSCSLNAIRGITTWPGSHYQSPSIKSESRVIDGKFFQTQGEARRVDWVIPGGESGAGARPFNIQWVRDFVAHCRGSGTAIFVKQLGARPYLHFSRSKSLVAGPGVNLSVAEAEINMTIQLRDRKGGDMSEWPEDLRVREFPR